MSTFRLTFALAAIVSLSGCTAHYMKSGASDEEGARAVAYCQMHQPPIAQPFLDNCMRSMGWVRSD